MSVTYFDQLLLAARQVHVVYLDQLLGAAHYIHFIYNHDKMIVPDVLSFSGSKIQHSAYQDDY